MSETQLLLRGLLEYCESLGRLTAGTTQQFSQLELRWHALNQVYDGVAAEQFRAGWLRTVARFREYQLGLDQIRRILAERIAHLEQFDHPVG